MAAYVGAMLVVSLLACAREPNQITFPPAISSEQGKFLEVRESGATVQVEHFRAANENATPPSFWNNLVANPAAALGVVGALVAALVTLVTFIFNYRATLQNQRDAQFYEALKRFGDQTSPVLRSSAAGLLAQMASRQNLFGNPYVETTLDQLMMGLLSEKDLTVLAAICKALERIGRINLGYVVETLRENNVQLQEDIIRDLANLSARWVPRI